MKAINTTIFTLLLLSFFSLSSCNKKTEPKKSTTNEVQKEQFLTLKLQRTNEVVLRAKTRTDDPMTQIDNLRFVFYKSSSGGEVVAQVIERVYSESMKDGFDIKLIPDDYKLIVLANPSDWLSTNTRIGSPIKMMTEAQELSTSSIYHFENGGQDLAIPMTNEQGAISIQRSQFHANGSSASSLSPIEIRLETMLARVLVFGTPQIKGTKPTGQQASYLVNNLAKSIAPLRPLAKLSSGGQEQQGDNSPKIERYALSTIWSKWASNPPTDTNLIASYSEEGYQTPDYWQNIKANIDDYKPFLDKSALIYAKETTLPPTAYLQGMTPCVIIKYPYAPEGLTLNNKEGWLSYQGTYYTESEAKALLSASSSEPNALKTALTQAGITTDDFKQGFQKGGISFYHQAYNYYTVYIRHFEDAKAKDAYGRYGIVRGNEYRIKIQNIERAGAPIPPTSSGNTEATPELESSAIKVFISELTARNQEITL